ncbi:hypothetical protein GSU75_03616 [Pseudomonas savastanoi pv. phaseolicola]|nr:hypothetical protein [Pseudomonas savastanoi pv. phaseolicola]
MFDNGMETTCGCVVGGAGLAGMGFLFNVLKTGAMPRIAAKGLVVIDASDRPGAGVLGEYRITANSVGDVFIDCLRDPALREVFEPLENSAAYWRIKARRSCLMPVCSWPRPPGWYWTTSCNATE